MPALATTVLFVFGLVALGYGAGRAGYLKAETGEGLAEFAVNVAMPLLLFRTMLSADFHGAAPWAFWGAYFCAVGLAWGSGHLLVTRMFGRDARAGVVGGVSSSFSNLVLLGIPFVLGVFGTPGFEVLSLLISVHLPTMIMASVILFELFGPKGDGRVHVSRVLALFARRVFANPMVIGILAGLAWRAGGLPLPPLAGRLVESLAGVAGPVALFSIGLGLCRFGLSGTVRAALALSAVKLFVMPATALATAVLFGLPPLTAKVAVMAAALPAGVNSYLIATQFGTGQALASNQMSLTTAMAVVTTSFWLVVVNLLFV